MPEADVPERLNYCTGERFNAMRYPCSE